MPVCTLVVDDQAVFRQTAETLIEATPGFVLVAAAASGAEGLAIAQEQAPDLVLVDVRMPGLDGIETARRLHEVSPTSVVVLISVDGLAAVPASVTSVGVAALLRKQDLSPQVLLDLWQTYGGSHEAAVSGDA